MYEEIELKTNIGKSFFAYRLIWIIWVIWVFLFVYLNIENYSDSERTSTWKDIPIVIPNIEKSSFIELTQDDIISQYNEVFQNLEVRREPTRIDINQLWNFENPFRTVR